MTIYVTGDKHGKFDGLFRTINYMKIDKEKDMIIILGDHALNYSYPNTHDKHKLSKFGKFFLVQGNHDGYRPDKLETFKEIDYYGGKAYMEDAYPNLIYAKFGEIYNFDNKKVIELGGAYSVDKYYRLTMFNYYHKTGYKWFDDEQPTDEMKNYAIWNLEKNNWKVDYVLSHTCPYDLIPREMFLSGLNNDKDVDQSMEHWLQYIYNNLTFDKWYFGHWHTSRNINDKVVCLYHQIIKFGNMVEDDYLDGVNS